MHVRACIVRRRLCACIVRMRAHLWVSHRTNIRFFTHPAVQVSAPEALFYAAKMQEASFHSAVLTAAAFDEVRTETSRAALGNATKIFLGAMPFTRAAVPRRRGGSAPLGPRA